MQLLPPHHLLLSLPCLGTAFAAPLGTSGQLEDRPTHRDVAAQCWAPSAPFSLPCYFSHSYIWKRQWKQLILSRFFFFFPARSLFCKQVYLPFPPNSGVMHTPPGNAGWSLSTVIAACPDAPNELFADKLQTCNYSQKLFSK